MSKYGTATEAKIDEVATACDRYGESSIIALAGVPGTGKSFIAVAAAQRFAGLKGVAGEPLLVQEVQFHQSFSYEEFIEGMRLDGGGGFHVEPGIFLDWNQRATNDSAHRYVLLIEELTRANLPAVLGEVLTYVEYRDRPFHTIYGRRPVRIAKNLTILATYNPTDRSALELDAALMRRLRIINCPPDTGQLREMMAAMPAPVVDALCGLFDACKKEHPDEYEHLMPFGHGIFAGVTQEQPDLYDLWHERIVHMLRRPLAPSHSFLGTIEEHYPWRKDKGFKVT